MSKFSELEKALARKGVRSPGGLAAYIGRRKLGAAEFNRRMRAGRRVAGRRRAR